MLFIRKSGFSRINDQLKQAYNIQMEKTKKGYHIIGFNNNKIINKTINLKKTKTKKYKKRKVIRKK
jgi:hypothetical protein